LAHIRFFSGRSRLRTADIWNATLSARRTEGREFSNRENAEGDPPQIAKRVEFPPGWLKPVTVASVNCAGRQDRSNLFKDLRYLGCLRTPGKAEVHGRETKIPTDRNK
jgi:hypothetical protein